MIMPRVKFWRAGGWVDFGQIDFRFVSRELGLPSPPAVKLHVLLNRSVHGFSRKVKKSKKKKKRTTSAKGVRKYITSPAETSETLKNNNNNKRGLRPTKRGM
jgi:hypothetical protein